MQETREFAIKMNKKPLEVLSLPSYHLQPKYLACDPLPDPANEKDLTTFITLWREKEEKTLDDCIKNCQVAEDVIKSIMEIYGEAIANYQESKQIWCREYIQNMRQIILDKYNAVCAHVFHYIEGYIYMTKEEKEAMEKKSTIARKNDSNIKAEFTLKPATKDLTFGLWGNVAAKPYSLKKVEFSICQSGVPRPQANAQIIMRILWTSNDYLTGFDPHDDFIVGGVLDIRIYQFPEQPKKSFGKLLRLKGIRMDYEKRV